MKIKTNISEDSGLIPFSKLPFYTPFTMPGNGIGSPNKLFIKLNNIVALIFDINSIMEVPMTKDVWVSQVEEIEINVTIKKLFV